MQLDLHPVAVVGKIVHKLNINTYIHRKKQYTKQYKAKHTKQNKNRIMKQAKTIK
jgi:hypothetical protein